MKLSKPEKILDFIEEWPEYLALVDGQNGRPLSYVIRKHVIPPPQGIDPAFGEPDSQYGSLRDEIIERAPHGTPVYQLDNAAVFALLNYALSDHKNVKTWIKGYEKTKNGRGAWEAFKRHFRGNEQLEAIEAAAEKQLATLVYRGEKARYNFETHVTKHLKAHHDILQAGGQIKERKKVRILLESLEASYLTACIATVRCNDTLQDDFDKTVAFIRTFIVKADVTDERKVAAVQGGGDKSKRKNNGKNNTQNRNKKQKGNQHENKGEDRYYTKAEWWALTQAQRDHILSLRKARLAQTAAVATGGRQGTGTTTSSVQTSQRK
jgi:hypothetical protein